MFTKLAKHRLSKTFALFMSVVMAMLAANTLPASANQTAGNASAAAAITATSLGGVTFTYPGLEDELDVNPNSTVNFHVHAHITQAARNANFTELRYEWLRNGEVWTGASGPGSTTPSEGTGSIPAGDIVNPGHAGIRLQLQGPAGQDERGGVWQLRVMTVVSGDVVFVDYTHTVILSVRQPGGGAEPTPAPTPTPPSHPGGGGWWPDPPTRPTLPSLSNLMKL